MTKRTVLVIEDDAAIRRGIVDALAFDSYAVVEAGDGDKGLKLALSAEYDLLLLDLVLPGKQGLEILKELREARPAVPVIILTALGEETDRVRGLKLGADDYVVKPFGVRELLARVQAVLRRSAERPSGEKTFRIPGGTVDVARREVHFAAKGAKAGGKKAGEDEKVALSEREAELFQYLAQNAGRVITREEILQRVWRLDPRHLETRTIDMHIARLREKLGDDPDNPVLIQTVRGKGYTYGKDEG